jgi:SET domain-containing protein
VFALQAIKAGERLLEYKGEVTSWRLAMSQYEPRNGESGHTFFFALSDGRVIDGARGGNTSRWLNHACAPNCATLEEDGRVFIEASADIDAGEELFIDYQLDIDMRRTAKVKAQYACRCGAPTCRGTMLGQR